ncbi:MAG: hypothetical protein M1149_02190 [Candidatus Thermoplasmatota archaeon]|jgi:hypothetical protein|nr:hypothetical protein [Candidatus Thermoplasmatota archaeon]
MNLSVINIIGGILMYFPSLIIILIAPSGLSLIFAVLPIIMVTAAVMIPERTRASISLRYYSIVPSLFVILFSRGFLASQIAVFPYIGSTLGIILGIGMVLWESGLIITQYTQTAINARSTLLDHGYDTEEIAREFIIFRNQVTRNVVISGAVSLFLFVILFVLPKIRTNVFILIIIFLIVYISLSRLFVRSDSLNTRIK